MPIVLCVLLVLSLIGSLTLLVASVWPGLLTDAAMLLVITSCIWIPLGAIITIVLLWRLFRRSARLAGRECVRPWGFAAVVLLSTLALLVLRVPMRIAFAVARPSLQPLLGSAPAAGERPAAVARWCGPYFVDSSAVDPRGGVYFRVYSGTDGIGPDTMSYGFTFKPNGQGSPFGAAHYALYRLSDDWFAFEASDDWY